MDSSDDEEEPMLISDSVPPGPKTVLSEQTYYRCLKDIIRRDFYLEKPSYTCYTMDQETPLVGSVTESTSRGTPSTRSNQTDKTRGNNLPSLNEFFSSYVSEDNAYFHTQDLKHLAKYRAKHPWMFRDGQSHNQRVEEQLKVPTMEKQASAGVDGKVKEPITWHHNPQGHVFFPPVLPIPERSSSTVNYNSNRLDRNLPTKDNSSPSHTTLRLFVKPNKIGIDGKFEDESSRGGEEQLANKGSQFTVQTDPDTIITATIPSRSKQEPGTAVAKPGQDKYYLPSPSPRDDLVHRIYEKKVAEAIRTPKHKKTPGTSSMTSVKNSSIFSTNSDRIRRAEVAEGKSIKKKT